MRFYFNDLKLKENVVLPWIRFKLFRGHIFLLLLAVVSTNVIGAQFYVSSSEGNDDNPGTKTSPWKTLKKAIRKTPTNDHLLLKRGDTFYLSSPLAINKTLHISAYGEGSLPNIDGQDHKPLRPYKKGIYASMLRVGTKERDNSAEGTTISNIAMSQSSGYCIEVFSKQVVVDGVECHEPGSNGIVGQYFSDGLEVRNSLVDGDNYLYAYGSYYSRKLPEWGSGISCRSAGCKITGNTITRGLGEAIILFDGSENGVVSHNKIQGGRVAIYVNGQNHRVFNNIAVYLDHKLRPTGSEFRKSLPEKSLRGHTCLSVNSEPIGLRRATDRGLPAPGGDIFFYNNICAGYTSQCFWYSDEIGKKIHKPSKFGKVSVVNNIFVDCGHGAKLGTQLKFDLPRGSNCSTLAIENNVFHDVTSPTERSMIRGGSCSGGNAIIKNNYFTVAPKSTYGAQSSVVGGLVLAGDSQYADYQSFEYNRTPPENLFKAVTNVLKGSGTASLSFDKLIETDYEGRPMLGNKLSIGVFQ